MSRVPGLQFVGSRIAVCLVAVTLAVPVGGATGCVLLSRNVRCSVGGGCDDLTVAYAVLMILGSCGVSAATSWVANRVTAWRRIRVPLVAMGAVAGMMIGVTSVTSRPIAASLLLAGTGAFLGALVRERDALDGSSGEGAAER